MYYFIRTVPFIVPITVAWCAQWSSLEHHAAISSLFIILTTVKCMHFTPFQTVFIGLIL